MRRQFGERYEAYYRRVGRWIGRRWGAASPGAVRTGTNAGSDEAPRTDGYSLLSVLVHWLAAVLLVSLFFTHEGGRGTTAYHFHVSGGAIAGLFLLWRVWHRVRRGVTDPPHQAAIFNLAARIVHWGLLLAIIFVLAPV